MSLTYSDDEEQKLELEWTDFCRKYDAEFVEKMWPRLIALEESNHYLANVVDSYKWQMEKLVENLWIVNEKLNKHVQ
jgi:hypothetical protein